MTHTAPPDFFATLDRLLAERGDSLAKLPQRDIDLLIHRRNQGDTAEQVVAVLFGGAPVPRGWAGDSKEVSR